MSKIPKGEEHHARCSPTNRSAIDSTHRSRSRDAVIRFFDAAGNVIETHEHNGDFKEPRSGTSASLQKLTGARAKRLIARL